MAREGPLGEGMGGTALGLQAWASTATRRFSICWTVKLGVGVASGSVFFVSGLALVFIGESSITCGVSNAAIPSASPGGRDVQVDLAQVHWVPRFWKG